MDSQFVLHLWSRDGCWQMLLGSQVCWISSAASRIRLLTRLIRVADPCFHTTGSVLTVFLDLFVSVHSLPERSVFSNATRHEGSQPVPLLLQYRECSTQFVDLHHVRIYRRHFTQAPLSGREMRTGCAVKRFCHQTRCSPRSRSAPDKMICRFFLSSKVRQ